MQRHVTVLQRDSNHCSVLHIRVTTFAEIILRQVFSRKYFRISKFKTQNNFLALFGTLEKENHLRLHKKNDDKGQSIPMLVTATWIALLNILEQYKA
jgi:hypothetical protein